MRNYPHNEFTVAPDRSCYEHGGRAFFRYKMGFPVPSSKIRNIEFGCWFAGRSYKLISEEQIFDAPPNIYNSVLYCQPDYSRHNIENNKFIENEKCVTLFGGLHKTDGPALRIYQIP